MNACKESLLCDLESVERCDFCGRVNFTQELVINGWNLLRCDFCDLVFTSPRYTEEHLRRIYEDSYYENASKYLSMQADEPSADEIFLCENLMKIFRKEINNRDLRVLDIGCGAGRLTKAFENESWDAVGIEMNKKAVNLGRNRGLDLHVGDLSDRSLGKFDLLTTFHVIEHVHSPKSFLQQCRERLLNNGYLIMEVPDYGSRRAKQMGKNWRYLYPDKHLYQFTLKTIRGYLNEAKFSLFWVRKVHGRGPLEDFSWTGESKLRVGAKIKGLLFCTKVNYLLVSSMAATFKAHYLAYIRVWGMHQVAG